MAYKNNDTSMYNNHSTTNKKSKSGMMKYEVADELGVNLGPDATSRDNGRVGGQITKELVARGKQGIDKNSLKNETANELGVHLGADATARSNGSVGGSMTKKLVNKGKQNSNY